MKKVITHEPDASRYAMHVDGQLASILDYRVRGDQIAFVRSFTNPPYRGKGLAGEVVAFAVDDVEATSTRTIVPACWYVGEWFDQHPERANLLGPRTA